MFNFTVKFYYFKTAQEWTVSEKMQEERMISGMHKDGQFQNEQEE